MQKQTKKKPAHTVKSSVNLQLKEKEKTQDTIVLVVLLYRVGLLYKLSIMK